MRYEEYKCTIPVIMIFLFSAILIFSSLGSRSIWGDESLIAVPALHLLQCRTVSFTCGNVFSSYDDLNDPSRNAFNVHGVWIFNSPLYSFLAAPFIAIFGRTSFAARIPFAIIGFLSIILFYYYSRRRLGTKEGYHEFFQALLIFALSVPLMLYFRQGRYYSIAVFSILLMAIGFENILSDKPLSQQSNNLSKTHYNIPSSIPSNRYNKFNNSTKHLTRLKLSGAILFGAAAGLLFHASYFLAITSSLAFLSYYFIFNYFFPSYFLFKQSDSGHDKAHKQTRGKAYRSTDRTTHIALFALSFVIFLLISLPWALYAGLYDFSKYSEIGIKEPILTKFARQGLQSLFNINNMLFPLVLLLLVLFALRSGKENQKEKSKTKMGTVGSVKDNLIFHLFIPFAILVFAALLMPGSTSGFHHLLFAFPFLTIAAVLLVSSIFKSGRSKPKSKLLPIIGWIIVLLLATTNIFSIVLIAPLDNPSIKAAVGSAFGSPSFNQFSAYSRPRFLLYEYISEASEATHPTHPINDRTSAISKFVSGNASETQPIMLLDNSLTWPLGYYSDNCFFVPQAYRWYKTQYKTNLMDGNTQQKSQNQQNQQKPGSSQLSASHHELASADWIISDDRLDNLNSAIFKEHVILYDYLGCFSGSAPFLDCRLFKPNNINKVYIYEREEKLINPRRCNELHEN